MFRPLQSLSQHPALRCLKVQGYVNLEYKKGEFSLLFCLSFHIHQQAQTEQDPSDTFIHTSIFTRTSISTHISIHRHKRLHTHQRSQTQASIHISIHTHPCPHTSTSSYRTLSPRADHPPSAIPSHKHPSRWIPIRLATCLAGRK